MKKAYVLVKNSLVENEGETEIRVFNSLEKALKERKEMIETSVKVMNADFNCEMETITNEFSSWSIWEMANYEYNHIDIIAVEKEVEE